MTTHNRGGGAICITSTFGAQGRGRRCERVCQVQRVVAKQNATEQSFLGGIRAGVPARQARQPNGCSLHRARRLAVAVGQPKSALCHEPTLDPSFVPGLSVLLSRAVHWPVHSHSGARVLDIHPVHNVRAVLHARVHGLSRVVDVHGHPHGESH
eukprot:scaffold33625_cov59-Phaeocystis_antarctica.AAC.4